MISVFFVAVGMNLCSSGVSPANSPSPLMCEIGSVKEGVKKWEQEFISTVTIKLLAWSEF